MKKKKYEPVDYQFVSRKRSEVVLESSKKIIKQKMIGTTSIEKVIDKNYEQLLMGGRYGHGIE